MKHRNNFVDASVGIWKAKRAVFRAWCPHHLLRRTILGQSQSVSNIPTYVNSSTKVCKISRALAWQAVQKCN